MIAWGLAFRHRDRAPMRAFGLAFTLLVTLVGSPGLAHAAPPAQLDSPTTDDAAPLSCVRGRLTVRDLAKADASLGPGLAEVTAEAQRWQPDARLVTLRLVCPLLQTGLQWEGTYFSDSVQSYYATDTGEISPAGSDPNTIPTLSVEELSCAEVYRSLIRGGYQDAAELSPVGGVTIQLSTDQSPFGPPGSPRNEAYFHVAVAERGEIKDLFISAATGTIYRYGM